MGLTDPLPDYEEILVILLPFNIAVALIIGIFYFWRDRKTKATITLLWALGFTGVGIGILINYLIRYTFYDYFSTVLPTDVLDEYSLFNTIGMLIITFSLALSTFFVRLFSRKAEKTGIILLSIITVVGLIILIVNSFIPFDEYNIGSWITRLLAIWVIIFFTYFSIHSKNYRILAITIGLILATTSGILMTQFHGTMLGLIGNLLQFIFYIFIAYGLFFTRQKTG